MRKKIENRIWIKNSIKRRLLKETKGLCAHCGTKLKPHDNMTVEHVIPLNKGGTNDESNLTVLCDICNKDKSDMILPISYYKYLPKDKRERLERQMSEYLHNVDYLSKDCLMIYDTYTVDIMAAAYKNSPGRKPIMVPSRLNIVKMDRNEAHAWMSEYGKQMPSDKPWCLYEHPWDIKTPFYMVKKGNRVLALMQPHMEYLWEDMLGTFVNEILIDWYFAPELPQTEPVESLLANTVTATMSYILSCLITTSDEAGVILMNMRCPAEDHLCSLVFDSRRMLKSDKDVLEDNCMADGEGSPYRRKVFTQLFGSEEKIEEFTKVLKGNPLLYLDPMTYIKSNRILGKRMDDEKGDLPC